MSLLIEARTINHARLVRSCHLRFEASHICDPRREAFEIQARTIPCRHIGTMGEGRRKR